MCCHIKAEVAVDVKPVRTPPSKKARDKKSPQSEPAPPRVIGMRLLARGAEAPVKAPVKAPGAQPSEEELLRIASAAPSLPPAKNMQRNLMRANQIKQGTASKKTQKKFLIIAKKLGIVEAGKV